MLNFEKWALFDAYGYERGAPFCVIAAKTELFILIILKEALFRCL